MNIYETSTTVRPDGHIDVAGVPFAPGTLVEVTIHPMRKTAEEFTTAWERVCKLMRTSTAVPLSDEEIQKEIDDYRAGR